MGVLKLSSTLSHLDLWIFKKYKMPMRVIRASKYALWITFFSSFICMDIFGYTVVTVSPTAPPSIESKFIAETTTQFNTILSTNSLFANTYQMILLGPNTNYNPAPTNKQLLDALVIVSTQNYLYGFADGMQYQQKTDLDIAADYYVQCSTPSIFNNGYSTSTWDFDTCVDAIFSVMIPIEQESNSTPTLPSSFNGDYP